MPKKSRTSDNTAPSSAASRTPATDTRIVLSASALMRAADRICDNAKAAGAARLSKNGVLNALAAAIAGPGHDWGFLKNRPDGTFTQPGLDAQQAPASGAAPGASREIWTLTYDEEDGYSHAPRAFASRDAALAAVAGDRDWWHHADHPFETVMDALAKHGAYVFRSESDLEDYEDSALRIRIDGLPVETPAGGAPVELTDADLRMAEAARAAFDMALGGDDDLQARCADLGVDPDTVAARATELWKTHGMAGARAAFARHGAAAVEEDILDADGWTLLSTALDELEQDGIQDGGGDGA